MAIEPAVKRTIVFVDGQNLFHAAKDCLQYTYPNYDPLALAQLICTRQGWQLDQVCFYTGIPHPRRDAPWHGFWSNKLAQMGREGVVCCHRPLRYRKERVELADGSMEYVTVKEEKGIDVRIALDVIRLARQRKYDVAVIVSQDQDFAEVASEIRDLAAAQHRWIRIASAFIHENNAFPRGIRDTQWLPLTKADYDSCIDTRDYRPKSPAQLPLIPPS